MRSLGYFLLVALFFLTACADENIKIESINTVSISSMKVDEVIQQVNAARFLGPDDPRTAFRYDGKVDVHQGVDQEQGITFIRFALRPAIGPSDVLFTISLDEAIQFGDQIDDATIAFIGNQLLVMDKTSGATTNFYVNDQIEPNHFSSVPVVDCVFLNIEKKATVSGAKINDEE